MKKILLNLALVVVFGLGLFSCGNAMDTEKATKEFCECSGKESTEKQSCYDAWVEAYKNGKATEESSKKMRKEMTVCNLEDAEYILMKAANEAD